MDARGCRENPPLPGPSGLPLPNQVGAARTRGPAEREKRGAECLGGGGGAGTAI